MTTNYRRTSTQHTTKQPLAIDANTASRLAEMASNTIGFDLERIGLNSIIRAAHKVQAYSKASTIETLEDQLSRDSVCRQLFIESIVVPESWLFREPKVFQHINILLCQRLKHQSGVKILSAPCANGEEACSIALSLLESGRSQTQFRIIATDISRHAIKQAQSGIFSENAFRTIDETRKNKWFTLTARGWQVAPKIQETVEFLDRNLLHSHTENELIQKAQGRFDLICCRNLLVYFTKPKRNKLIRTLARLLKPNGELVVGAAEAVILPTGDWEPTGPLTFRMRKKTGEAPPVQQKVRQESSRKTPTRDSEEIIQFKHANPTVPSDRVTVIPASSSEIIHDVEALANAGAIEDAIQLCQKSLQSDSAQTDLLYMLAILHQTGGDFETSEKLLEKAVYLEPRHEGALLSLALIAKRRGDTTAERRYRRSASFGGLHS
jgi:chemotaxis protein methyltransferase WspC